MVGHRGPEFQELVVRVSEGMRPAFETGNDVMILTSSGTGGLEAAIVSFLSPGDPVLAVSIGNFGERFAKIARAYGASVEMVEFEWGQAADPEAVREAIRAWWRRRSSPRAVLVTFNETSTGVTNPLAELAAVIRAEAPDTLILVDGVSAVGAMPLQMDAWDLDVVVTGSQKAWMIPPGLAMVAASERAWSAAETATMPRFYFDLAKHRDVLPKGQTPWTPAVGIFFQLEAALELIEAEGWEAIYARHAACGAACACRPRGDGLRAVRGPGASPRTRSPRRSSPRASSGPLSTGQLHARGLVLAGGQGKLKGKIFRIGHLGDVDVADIVSALDVIEQGADAVGLSVRAGAGRPRPAPPPGRPEHASPGR